MLKSGPVKPWFFHIDVQDLNTNEDALRSLPNHVTIDGTMFMLTLITLLDIKTQSYSCLSKAYSNKSNSLVASRPNRDRNNTIALSVDYLSA